LLEFSAWFPQASPVGVSNDLMASRPGHPVFGRLVHSLQSHNKNYLFTYLTVFWSTGPMFVNTILKDWYRDLAGKAHSGELSKNMTDNHTSLDRNHIKNQIKVHRYSGPSDVAILPQTFYSEEYTFFGHRPGSSWHGDDVAIVLWIYERLWVVLGAGFILVVITFAIRRARRKRMAYSRLRGLYGKAA
jgi:mannosyltransferase OCH1-like enzyme